MLHSVVSIARSSALSADRVAGSPECRFSMSARIRPSASSPACCAGAPNSPGMPVIGPASGGTSRPGAGSHATASDTASWISSPIGLPVAVEELE